ncbi:MAG: hypothetical protein ACKVTZ_21045 [Bacteroidia bacterium]
MKAFRFFVLVIFIAVANVSSAQDCNKWYPMQQGVEYEMTTYSNGKVVTTVTSKITAVERGSTTKATIEQQVFDKNQKSIGKANGNVTCAGEKWYFNTMVTPSAMPNNDIETKITENSMVFTTDLNVGTTLPDGKVVIKSSMNGTTLMELTTIETERKCVAKEKITTPAGTFDCYKVTAKSEMKGLIPMKLDVAYWYAEGVGLVKTESFKNGKSNGSTVMTKLRK